MAAMIFRMAIYFQRTGPREDLKFMSWVAGIPSDSQLTQKRITSIGVKSDQMVEKTVQIVDQEVMTKSTRRNNQDSLGGPFSLLTTRLITTITLPLRLPGPKYDPEKPINDSPNNTGARELPPAQKAMIWYPYASSDEFPLVGSGGRNAMAGPVYHADQFQDHPNRFPDYYDDKLFIYDWMRGWMMAVSFDENGDMKSMEPFLPSIKWNNLMDVVMGPEGDFYTLEYGTGWFTANENAILSRVTYNPGNRAPQSDLIVPSTAQGVPFTADFDASGSVDADGDDLTFEWDFGDGNTGRGAKVQHTYETPGEYVAKVTVSDGAGASSSSQAKILAGNTPPEVAIEIEGNQSFYFPGQPLKYKVVATDKEDGTIDPENIALSLDYLEMGYDMTSIAQGHMALSESKTGHPGQGLIAQSDCVSCHKVDGTSVGPSYLAISDKYNAQRGRKAGKVSYLVEKIIKGGGGVWGETAMAAHPDIKPKDAAQMAAYILTVGQEEEKQSLPASGTHMLAIPEGKSDGGNFVLMASYTDKGTSSVEPIRTFANVVLRPSNLSAVDYSSVENGTPMSITPEMMPGIEEAFDIVIVNDEALVQYDDLDLTGISSMVLTCSAPAMFAAGGSFDIYLDNKDGDPIYSGKIETSMAMGAVENIPIPLNGANGKHKLLANFKSNKEGSPVGILMNWALIPQQAM